MTDAREIAQILLSCSTVLISVHKSPDGDALGSQIGLMLALERIGKKVTAHNLDPVPEIYKYLPAAGRVQHGPVVSGRYDALVVLDSDPPRTGLYSGSYPAGFLINIDHHITNPAEWPLTWLDPSASATGEMIYRLLTLMALPVDRDIALSLYTSIFTDTGSFRYTNTSPECMRVSAALLEAGANPWIVTENVYESHSFKRIKLLGAVLSAMERNSDGTIAWVVVDDELYRKTGTTAEDTDNFVNYARSVKGVEVAVLFRQTGAREYKISFRSKGRVDLSQVAKSLNGGGHKNAAGGTVSGTLDEVRTRVINEVKQAVNDQLKAKVPC